MENIQTITSLIEDSDARKLMNEVLDAIEEMSHKQPTIGFHHRFYVPGWIGAIQSFIVELKMDKWGSLPFYKDKNYYEFAEWIGEIAHQFHNYLDKPEIQERKDYTELSNNITSAIRALLIMWAESAPEIASLQDRDYHDDLSGKDYKVSIAYLLNKQVESEIGKYTESNTHTTESSFWADFKDQAKSYGNWILGYLINIGIFALIVWIIDLIF